MAAANSLGDDEEEKLYDDGDNRNVVVGTITKRLLLFFLPFVVLFATPVILNVKRDMAAKSERLSTSLCWSYQPKEGSQDGQRITTRRRT